MAWTNAFDAGACVVKVNHIVAGELYSGALGKGESSAEFPGFIGDTLKVAVSLGGDVSLEIVGTVHAQDYALRVVPSYDISQKSIRAGSFGINLIPVDAFTVVATSDYNSPFDSTVLTHSEAAWSPDPCDLSSNGSKVEISVDISVNPA